MFENENSQNAIENNQNNQETENKIRNEDSKILKCIQMEEVEILTQ